MIESMAMFLADKRQSMGHSIVMTLDFGMRVTKCVEPEEVQLQVELQMLID